MIELSNRVRALKPSATLAVGAKAAELRAQGENVVTMAGGEPDFDTPQAIKDAAIASIEAGKTKYAPVPGDPATRELIAKKLTEENSIPNCTADHVVVTAGGKQALFHLFMALFNEGEPADQQGELLLPVPAWVSYKPQAELAGAKVVEIPTDASTSFKMSPEQLEAAITPNSKVLSLNSPSNPCGTMYTPGELKAIAAVVAKHPQLVVISDEIYEKLTFGGIEHFSIGSVPEIAERVITVNGLSKAYAMTGWRIGYLAGSGELGKQIAGACKKLQGQSTTSIPGFFAPAIKVAMEESAEEVESMRQVFAQRAKLMHDRLSKISGVICPEPTGAFYCFPDVSVFFGATAKNGETITSGLSFAGALLEEEKLAVVPGDAFGTGGEKCIRLSFACSNEQIEEALTRLERFVASLGVKA